MSESAVTTNFTIPPESTTSTCSYCGNHVPALSEAQRRISELETQVRLLNAKAASAVDKLADHEDEVRTLRATCARLQQQQQQQPPPPPASTPSPSLHPEHQQPLPSPLPAPSTTTSPQRATSRLASLSSFLPGRKRDTALLQGPPPNTPASALFPQSQSHPQQPQPQPQPGWGPPRSNTADSHTSFPSLEPSATLSERPAANPPLTLLSLQTSLETERTLRLRAESNLTQTQTELEELTATLFGQANEMVAAERKARAKLEERVKVLEDRDGEKRRRLDRLERALERIDRVRGLVREEERERLRLKEQGVTVVVGEVVAPEADDGLRVVNR